MYLINTVFKCDWNKPLPWQRMFICAGTATLPLVVGFHLGQTSEAVLGSLLGVALSMNDHGGVLKDRFNHLATTSLFLIAAYAIGSILNHSVPFFFTFLFLFSFLLGKVKGKGIELERLLLFTLLNIVTVAGLKLPIEDVVKGSAYAVANFFFYLLLLVFIDKRADLSKKINKKRHILKDSFKERKSFLFAMTLSVLTTASYLFAYQLKMQREYWIAGTVLIVMIPELSQTWVRSIQRFLGTLAGILLVFIVMKMFGQSYAVVMGIIFFSAAFIPVGMNVNFFMANTFISGFVFCLIKITLPKELDLGSVALLRLMDIGVGGLIGSAGIFASHRIHAVVLKVRRSIPRV